MRHEEKSPPPHPSGSEKNNQDPLLSPKRIPTPNFPTTPPGQYLIGCSLIMIGVLTETTNTDRCAYTAC